MTSDRPTASWPVSLACGLAGLVLPGATFLLAMAVAEVGAGTAGDLIAQLVGAAGLVGAILVAARLPRRARALFVTGVVTAVVLAVGLVVLLIWALWSSNFTF